MPPFSEPLNVIVSARSTVTLAQFGPCFSLLDGKHVAGIILRSDGSGADGGGAYDIIGPTGSALGYKTVAAKAGDASAKADDAKPKRVAKPTKAKAEKSS